MEEETRSTSKCYSGQLLVLQSEVTYLLRTFMSKGRVELTPPRIPHPIGRLALREQGT
jgi:hypothetical protein